MKRLAFIPVLFAAGICWGWLSGYGWPIATTIVRPLLPRPVLAETEPEIVG